MALSNQKLKTLFVVKIKKKLNIYLKLSRGCFNWKGLDILTATIFLFNGHCRDWPNLKVS